MRAELEIAEEKEKRHAVDRMEKGKGPGSLQGKAAAAPGPGMPVRDKG